MSRRAKIWAALWAVYILWGSTYLAIAVAVETLPPLLAASARFISAGSVLAAIVLLRGGSLRIGRSALVSSVGIGCLLPGGNAVLFFAEREVPIGLASLIVASVPLWIVVLRLLGRERLPAVSLAAVGVGLAGVAVLARPTGGAGVAGLVLCLVSAVMWSLGSVAASRLERPGDPLAATAYEMLAGGLVMLPGGIATAHSFSPSVRSVLAWGYLIVFGSVVGYTAYSWLLRHAPIGTVATYAYVNPVVAILLGVLVLDESLDARTLLGAAVVVGSVAVVVRREAPEAAPPQEGVP